MTDSTYFSPKHNVIEADRDVQAKPWRLNFSITQVQQYVLSRKMRFSFELLVAARQTDQAGQGPAFDTKSAMSDCNAINLSDMSSCAI